MSKFDDVVASYPSPHSYCRWPRPKDDLAPWKAIARQIIDGQFPITDKAVRRSLARGLRAIPDPVCQQALKTLRK